jgi:flagellar biosynthesis/type III secretory pathway M-ring protein FliF/YscJ
VVSDVIETAGFGPFPEIPWLLIALLAIFVMRMLFLILTSRIQTASRGQAKGDQPDELAERRRRHAEEVAFKQMFEEPGSSPDDYLGT